MQVAFKAHNKYIIKQFINCEVHSKVKFVINKLVMIVILVMIVVTDFSTS